MISLYVIVETEERGVVQKKYGSVLGYDSPFDLVCKLERERERMRGAKTLDKYVDHAMNFALTAYHMTDWVWAVIERGATETAQEWERDQWIAVLGFEPTELRDVLNWARAECPELEYCRQLANASKHLSCTLKKDAPAAEFEVAATDQWKRAQKEAPFTSILDSHLAENWRLVLVDSGKEIDLVEVLESRVFDFWSELTYRIYIGEG